MSTLSIYLPGKRLLKSRSRLPLMLPVLGRNRSGVRKNRSLSVRANYDITSASFNPITLFTGVRSPAFNILGTLSLAMVGVLLVGLQSPVTKVETAKASAQILYQEYQNISHFPKTKAIEQQLLATNKLASYLVASGDSVNSICSALSTDCEALKSLNQLEYPYTLKVGQSLYYKK